MRKRRTIEAAIGLVLLSVLVGAAAGWAKNPKPAGPPPDAQNGQIPPPDSAAQDPNQTGDQGPSQYQPPPPPPPG